MFTGDDVDASAGLPHYQLDQRQPDNLTASSTTQAGPQDQR